MRKLLLSLAVLGTVSIAPASAAPVVQPAIVELDRLDQITVQPVQFGYSRREIRRREEVRRREAYHRRHAARRGYRRIY